MRKNRWLFIRATGSVIVLSTITLSGLAQSLVKDHFPTGKYLDGDFIAAFTKDGKITVYTEDFIKADGFYKAPGDQIIFKDRYGGAECAGEGKYRWKFDGEALTFTKIEDACTGRAHHLTSRKWQLLKRQK